MKIAVQDDVEIWRFSINQLLSMDGHQVDVFTEESIIPPNKQYDVVIMDNMLGRGDTGQERLCNLRRHGFEGKMLLYTTEAHLACEITAKKFGFEIVSKDEYIDDIVAKFC